MRYVTFGLVSVLAVFGRPLIKMPNSWPVKNKTNRIEKQLIFVHCEQRWDKDWKLAMDIAMENHAITEGFLIRVFPISWIHFPLLQHIPNNTNYFTVYWAFPHSGLWHIVCIYNLQTQTRKQYWNDSKTDKCSNVQMFGKHPQTAKSDIIITDNHKQLLGCNV